MNDVLTIIKKEFKDILRDRKTMITSILIPLLLMPVVMYISMSSSMNMSKPSQQEVVIGSNILNEYTAGLEATQTMKIKVEVYEDQTAFFNDYHSTDVYIQFPENMDITKQIKVNLHYNTNSSDATNLANVIEKSITETNNQVISNYLKNEGIDPNIMHNLKFDQISTVESTKDMFSLYMMSLLLPMLILGYSSVGITPLATDLGAGEKERGTLEPLLITKVKPSSIILGKLFVISVFGVLSIVLSTIGTVLAVNLAMPKEVALNMSFTMMDYLFIFLIGALFTIFMSAVSLTLSILARNNKEATTYLAPVSIIPMVIAFLAISIDVTSVSMNTFNIPILNAAVIIKEIIYSSLNMTHLMITVGWSLVYIIISIIVTRYAFTREDVVFRS